MQAKRANPRRSGGLPEGIIERAPYRLVTTLPPRQRLLCNLMKTSLNQTLGDLQGATITGVEATPYTATLYIDRPGRQPLELTFTGCPYQDTRCASCSCDPDSYHLKADEKPLPRS